MGETGLKANGREEQSADQAPPQKIGVGWLGAWGAVLAYALWLSRLSIPWLALSAFGAILWTMHASRRREPAALLAMTLMWLGIGIASGIQFRLRDIALGWDDLQLRVEDRAADALGDSLDELVNRGERAVDGAADAARLQRDQRPTPELFAELASLRQQSGVSAIALFAPDGSTIAWAGEHRGSVPEAARLGTENYLFHEGPLFSYLYFVRPLPEGVTATAAFLLEAALEAGEGVVPFAESFERRHGTRPRFWHPDRARAEAVWDWATDRPILSVSFVALTQQRWWERVVENGRRGAGLAGLGVLLLLSFSWYRSRISAPAGPVLAATAALLLSPLGRLTGAEALFSPLQFVLPGPLDITLGVLLVLLTGASIWMLIRLEGDPIARLPIWLSVPLVALLFPLALWLVERSAAEGLMATRAAGGFAVQGAAALLIALPLFLVLRHSRAPLGHRLPLRMMRVGGYALPAIFGLLLLLWWNPQQPVPVELAALWAIPAGLLIVTSLQSRSPMLSGALGAWWIAGWLSGTAALAFLYPLHLQAELARAEREVSLLGTQADPYLDFLLRQFAEQAQYLADEGEQGVNLLYRSWVASGLAREGYEARMALWRDGEPVAELNLSESGTPPENLVPFLPDEPQMPVVQHFGGVGGLHYLLATPVDAEGIISLAVPPRRQLTGATPLARLLHPDQAAETGLRGESLHLVPVDRDALVAEHASVGEQEVEWVRTQQGWRSEALVEMPEGLVHAHLIVADPGIPLLLTRAILLISGLLLALTSLWLIGRGICQDLVSVPLLNGAWLQTFRGRLSLALFGFFLLPTLVFGVVSYSAVAREVVRSAAALAQQALEQAAVGLQSSTLREVGSAVPTDLLLYSRGSLVGATPPEVLELGLFHTWLSPPVYLRFAGGEDLQGLEERRLAESDYLVAYRRLDAQNVIAAATPLASHEISRRQQEFRDVALLMIMLGLGLSIVLAVLVSRALSRPLDQLSRAAATVGAGDFRTRLPAVRSDEFGSVYASFNQMVQRLRETRAALVQETRRTETIVAEAATGVLALDGEGQVELINPRAAEILGDSLSQGTPLLGPHAHNGVLGTTIQRLWRSPSVESAAEVELDGRLVRLKLRRLPAEDGRGGAVVALEDITSEVRTARVLAWGEMARQVAHEIKNPLTPIKLAVQHLRRAYLDQRPDFSTILDRNVESILREIDRLGDIARAFARFGTPNDAASPLEPVDVERVVSETLALYSGSGGDLNLEFDAPGEPLPPVIARPGEFKEVLLNLLENAREAIGEDGEIRIGAQKEGPARVALLVEDDGVGIPEHQVDRIFEPHFSTRSSGTGLGLAIVRRIVDSWGGEIRVHSTLGKGTRFEIMLQVAEDPGVEGGG